MKLRSHALVFKDFDSNWYKQWAKVLKQDDKHLDSHELYANKFWQNAIICRALEERGVISHGSQGIGFGVGQERVPAALASRGARIMATDQDSRREKAGRWAERELAVGASSLNGLGICDSRRFEELVSFDALDMTKIPKKLYDQFDFAWSNCALGHLGTINKGLDFIEESLLCLKPGGWAVHTTEMNILSDEDTAESGHTVVFRLSDIYRLYAKLSAAGYKCQMLDFNLGSTEKDWRISLRPQFGNDYSKIQINGHLATQVALIFHRPKKMRHKKVQKRMLNLAYRRNLRQMSRFVRTPEYQQLLASKITPPEQIKITPKSKNLTVKIAAGQKKLINIGFKNRSDVTLFSMDGCLKGYFPILLATDGPHDRRSVFAGSAWFGTGRNRPGAKLVYAENSLEHLDRIAPGRSFVFPIELDAKDVKPGKYTESFSVVQENAGWVSGSRVTISVSVV